PYCFLLNILVKRASSKLAYSIAFDLKDRLQRNYKVIVEGPSPAFQEKINNKFQWHLVVKASQRNELLKLLQDIPKNVLYDLDPMDLL
ncbi:MAG TPA: hypothetical protein VLF63_02385, partial [Patescibacteria group bacterium]|nr:hypothetical protein [Patescibacteria group bacterium]